MKVSFILLAHEHPDQLYDLITSLLAAGSDIYLHYDARAPHDIEQAVQAWGLDGLPGDLYFAERVHVVWGEWSIVQATLNCLYLARQQGFGCDYLMLLSGSCMPVRPIESLGQYLDADDKDYIEAVDAEKNRWVTAGIQQERWQYYHYFNWRSQEFRFRLSNKIQKLMKVNRALPLGHTPYMGSQWWCLRTSTVEKILELVDEKPELASFYRYTWVPDELFFQTMVGNLVPRVELSSELLTRYRFNSWGVPRVYYDDALPELLGEKLFFARKISHRALKLKQTLSRVGAMSVAQYSDYLASHESELKRQRIAGIELDRQMTANAWHSLAGASDNPYEYCKSFPIPLIVVCSLDDGIKYQATESLQSRTDVATHGDLLNAEEIGFGDEQSRLLGYDRGNPGVARHRWHFFLGDIISHAPHAKGMVFTMGKEATEYLEVLRWSAGVTVVLLKETQPPVLDSKNLAEIGEFERSRQEKKSYEDTINWLMKDRQCSYHVVSEDYDSTVSDIALSLMARVDG